MKVALAQINTTVGDINGNTRLILDGIARGIGDGAELIVFPELAIFGYPPKDLLLRESLVARNVEALHRIARACDRITAVVGFVQPLEDGHGTGIANAAALCGDGKVRTVYQKRLLPTYDVFDEARYFTPGQEAAVVAAPGQSGPVNMGLTICEDLWNDRQFEGRKVYGVDPIAELIQADAKLIVNIAASPFVAGKQADREALFGDQLRGHGASLIAVNQVGGNDDLIFDGASFVLDPSGKILARAKAFAEDYLVVDTQQPANAAVGSPYPDHIESIRLALRLGIHDYVSKCGFDNVLIGLSGGIDSAVTAALAVEALGADRVCGVTMPSRYSSEHSVEDARQLASTLGIRCLHIPIEGVHRSMENALADHFGDGPVGVAEENVQARIRGNLLMGLSNKFGSLLLTTGNKSELAVGYCTLYGDMCGGLAVLSDVPKTTVYELARRINERSDAIPQRTIDKPPSAELREHQTDADSLPPYDVLDAVLEHYVEHDRDVDAIIALGFDADMVRRVARMVDGNEHKRMQAPVGLKVTSRAFGTGRRMPIAARY